MTRTNSLAILTTLTFGLAAFAQQQPTGDPRVLPPGPTVETPDNPDAPAPPQGGLHGKPALTEEEQREQRIRAVDPLAKPDTGDAQTPAPDEAGKPRPAAQPLRGSVAAGSQRSTPLRNSGPAVEGDDPTAIGPEQYTGPAVLSRAYTLNRPTVSQYIKWTPTLGFSGEYQTGLTGNAVNTDGTLNDLNSMATRVNWGLVGSHRWRRDQLRVDYRGDINHFASASSYSGSNHDLNVSLTHVASRHIIVNLSGTAASFTQSYTLSNPALSIDSSVANVNLAASPLVQIMDNNLHQGSLSASLIWQKSARLSFNFSSGTFGVVRSGPALIGNTGYTSSADVNYRYTRKATLGAYYSFSDFVFSHRVQVANTHTTGLIFSYAFSRSFELRTRFGGTRIESEGQTVRAIDPAIAALLGQASVIVQVYSRRFTSDVSAELAKDFGRRHTAKLSYARGISPGNGIQLASVQTAATAGFSTALFRRNTVDIGGGRTSLTSSGQTLGQYTTNYVSVGLSHQYTKGFAQNLTAYYRTFDITSTTVAHAQILVSMGFSWSPGENPIHF